MNFIFQKTLLTRSHFDEVQYYSTQPLRLKKKCF